MARAERVLRGRRGLRAVGTAAALVVWSVPAAAEPPGESPRHRPPPHHGRPPHGPPPPEAVVARHADRLALDEETLTSIHAISMETRAASEEGRAALEAAQARMRELLDEDVPDEARVMEQAERIGALETRNRQLRLRAILAIRELLSEEQRSELVRIRDESRSRRSRPPGPLGPCAVDLEDLCPESRPGRGSLRCLANRWDEVSRPCRSFVQRGPPSR